MGMLPKMKCCWHFWRRRYVMAGWRRPILWDKRWCGRCMFDSKVPGWERDSSLGFMDSITTTILQDLESRNTNG